MLLRHLSSIAVLPFVVTVLVPRWLLAREAVRASMPSVLGSAGQLVGTAVFASGLALFTWCVLLFARVGRGTLAPWDPTRRLVVVGPYRHLALIGWGSPRAAVSPCTVMPRRATPSRPARAGPSSRPLAPAATRTTA